MSGMDGDVFETLDAYRDGKGQLSNRKLKDCYRKAVNEVRQLILDSKKKLGNTEEKVWAEIEENAVDEECIRSRIVLYEERLYDLSSDGELGQKISSDLGGNILEVKNFEELSKDL